MLRYDRTALVLDAGGAALAGEARGLEAAGLRILRAAADHELAEPLRAWGGELAAVVVPGEIDLALLERVRDRLRADLPRGGAALVAVAPPRQRARLVALRERGVRWVVFAPFDASELRFAVAAALASDDVLEPRRGLRVPIRMAARLRHDRATHEAEVTNLSVGGVHLALAAPPAVGATVFVEFPIGERLLRAQARVAHASASGCGLAFAGTSALDQRLLEGFVKERVDSFRL